MAIRGVHLRPFGDKDLDLLFRCVTDPSFTAPYDWHGYRSFNELRRRWEEDEFLTKDPRSLVVADGADVAVGCVDWREPQRSGPPGSVWEIGIVLAPEHRGTGIGTLAHSLLIEHLLATTTVHRLTANTAVENVAERRCLERAGFHCDGVLRHAGFLNGHWSDVATYSLLRADIAKNQVEAG